MVLALAEVLATEMGREEEEEEEEVVVVVVVPQYCSGTSFHSYCDPGYRYKRPQIRCRHSAQKLWDR